MKLKLEDFHQAIDEFAKAMKLEQHSPESMAFYKGVADGEEQGSELSMGMTYENLDRQDAYDKGTYLGAAIHVAITGKP